MTMDQSGYTSPGKEYICQSYTLQDEDTVDSLASRHNLTVEDLTSANRDVSFISGKQICIPIPNRNNF